MGSVAKLNRLSHHVHATDYDGSAEVQGRTQYSKLLRDLERELSEETGQVKTRTSQVQHTYRVGVRTRAKMPYGSTASFCRIGNAKAIVLPDPVFALPMQSLP